MSQINEAQKRNADNAIYKNVTKSRANIMRFMEAVSNSQTIAKEMPNTHAFIASLHTHALPNEILGIAAMAALSDAQKKALDSTIHKYAPIMVPILMAEKDETIEREAIESE